MYKFFNEKAFDRKKKSVRISPSQLDLGTPTPLTPTRFGFRKWKLLPETPPNCLQYNPRYFRCGHGHLW